MSKFNYQNFINSEHDSLLTSIDLFRKLLPHDIHDSSVHSGEEGIFIELALTQYLREKLPSGIGIGSGFVVDIESGWNSKQIDILLYDEVRYSPHLKYGDAIVLPIQAVIGAISVKRKLYKSQLNNEICSLTEIGSRSGGMGYPKPYLSIVAFDSEQKDILRAKKEIFSTIDFYYKPRIDKNNRKHLHSWNELLDSVIVFDQFIIKGSNFSASDKKKIKSKYMYTGGNGIHRNLYLQHLLHGVHRSWYHQSRGNKKVGKLLSIPKGGMKLLGGINICTIDRKYTWEKFKSKII